MKTTEQVIEKAPTGANLFFLIALVAVAFAAYQYFRPATVELKGEGQSIIEINADSILAICELAGASQRVTVLFDTTFRSQSADLVVMGVKFFTRDEILRYSEQRVWEIKAGTTKVDIEYRHGKPVLLIAAPTLLSCTELEEEFKILHSTADNWSPAHLHLHVARSRHLAESKALRLGILVESMRNIEKNLKQFVPNTPVEWKLNL